MNPSSSEKTLVWFATAVMLAQIATYPQLFFFNPFASELSFGFQVVQLFVILAWPVQLVVWPLLYNLLSARVVISARIFKVLALVWPFSIILVQLGVLLVFGVSGLSYLLSKPIFILSDIVIPILYFRLASRIQN